MRSKMISRRVKPGQIETNGCLPATASSPPYTFSRWMEILTEAIAINPSPEHEAIDTITFLMYSNEFHIAAQDGHECRIPLPDIAEALDLGYLEEQRTYFKTLRN